MTVWEEHKSDFFLIKIRLGIFNVKILFKRFRCRWLWLRTMIRPSKCSVSV